MKKILLLSATLSCLSIVSSAPPSVSSTNGPGSVSSTVGPYVPSSTGAIAPLQGIRPSVTVDNKALYYLKNTQAVASSVTPPPAPIPRTWLSIAGISPTEVLRLSQPSASLSIGVAAAAARAQPPVLAQSYANKDAIIAHEKFERKQLQETLEKSMKALLKKMKEESTFQESLIHAREKRQKDIDNIEQDTTKPEAARAAAKPSAPAPSSSSTRQPSPAQTWNYHLLAPTITPGILNLSRMLDERDNRQSKRDEVAINEKDERKKIEEQFEKDMHELISNASSSIATAKSQEMTRIAMERLASIIVEIELRQTTARAVIMAENDIKRETIDTCRALMLQQ